MDADREREVVGGRALVHAPSGEPLEHWGMDEKQTADEFSVPIRIIPERIRSW